MPTVWRLSRHTMKYGTWYLSSSSQGSSYRGQNPVPGVNIPKKQTEGSLLGCSPSLRDIRYAANIVIYTYLYYFELTIANIFADRNGQLSGDAPTADHSWHQPCHSWACRILSRTKYIMRWRTMSYLNSISITLFSVMFGKRTPDKLPAVSQGPLGLASPIPAIPCCNPQ